ncbi:MAG: hypothetical protein QME05_04495 [Candidatus Margulisbacteria bacterium]|nr:hypothetical protein [Candidatus Margulisiibacteriota bacterium]
MENNNQQRMWEGTSSQKFNTLTARQVLEWMEEAGKFIKQIYRDKDIENIQKMKVKHNV